MSYFVEIGPGREVIEWRPHLLSEVMADYAPALTLEPVRHPESDFAGLHLASTADYKGVSWNWARRGGAWRAVRALPLDTPEPCPPLTKRPPEPGRFKWEDLSFCGAVELTPLDEAGQEGVTEKLACPFRLTPADVACEGPDAGWLTVRLLTYMRPGDLRVRLLKLAGAVHERTDESYGFNERGFSRFRVRERFKGAVAVVHARGGAERLMYYVGWPGGDRDLTRRFHPSGEPLDAHEWEELRRCVEGAAPNDAAAGEFRRWLAAWPGRSRARLEEIYEEARRSILRVDEAARALRETPAGLFRTLVLYRCEYQFNRPLVELMTRLDGGTMEEALERLAPRFASLLSEVYTAAEKRWVVRHAGHPKVAEAVEWMGGHGTAALDNALDLIGVRDSVEERKEKLRRDTPQRQEAEEILKKINDAPLEVGSVGELQQKVEEIAQAIEVEEGREVNPDGPAPFTVNEYRRWVARRRLMLEWRAGLLRVIIYCESGLWHTLAGLAEDLPAADELGRRLERLRPPGGLSVRPPLRMVEDHTAELAGGARALVEQQGNEPSEPLRRAASRRLQEAVLDRPGDWALMHEQVRRADAQAAQYPWFAETAGLLGPGLAFERVEAARQFFDMVEALEERAAAWTNGPLAGGEAELKALLADPNHPAIEAALGRARELYDFLKLTEHVRNLPPPELLPAPPARPTRVALQTWWDGLGRLDGMLRRLAAGRRRFEDDVRQFQKNLQAKVGRRRDYWDARPPAERPDYYSDLVSLSERCAGPADGVRPADLLRLLRIIERDEGLRG